MCVIVRRVGPAGLSASTRLSARGRGRGSGEPTSALNGARLSGLSLSPPGPIAGSRPRRAAAMPLAMCAPALEPRWRRGGARTARAGPPLAGPRFKKKRAAASTARFFESRARPRKKKKKKKNDSRPARAAPTRAPPPPPTPPKSGTGPRACPFGGGGAPVGGEGRRRGGPTLREIRLGRAHTRARPLRSVALLAARRAAPAPHPRPPPGPTKARGRRLNRDSPCGPWLRK